MMFGDDARGLVAQEPDFNSHAQDQDSYSTTTG
jgi:hypothetical protein